MKKLALATVALAMMASLAAITAPAAQAAEADTINICTKTVEKRNGTKISVVKITERDSYGKFTCEAVQCTVAGRFCVIDPADCDVSQNRRKCRTTADLKMPEAPEAPAAKAPAQAYPEIVNVPKIKILGDISFDQAAIDSWSAANPAPAYVAHDFTPGNVDPAEWAAYLDK